MKPGDLVQPVGEVCTGMNHTQILPRDRYIHINDEFPWDECYGMIGKTHRFPCGTLGIYLSKKVVNPNPSGHRMHRIFYKILTSDGIIGWVHESWVRRIQ